MRLVSGITCHHRRKINDPIWDCCPEYSGPVIHHLLAAAATGAPPPFSRTHSHSSHGERELPH
jgi:hypothetical protein